MEMALPLMGRVFSHQVAEQQVNREESSMEPGVSMSKGLVFNGSTLLWSSMLEDTAGLRSAIIPGEATTPDDDIFEYEENIGASLILGSAVPLPLQKVLFQYLPPRQEADRLTAAYFGILVTGANTGMGFEMVRALCNSEVAYEVPIGGSSLVKAGQAANAVMKEFPSTRSRVFKV
ncbi:hypothetical protein HO133_008971 [Letharia lupina]|uniref:Uncharacterized protein n=1 Tax=Letharia lupina TaxID=560253 RepID=A0A8H6CMT1_9LECA|nr:uncharacterized protein HO133_008971 [Letharia lupina]KAF6226106.1 hypothetical protein HO133_008971 [Letharia lupina]